MMKKFAALFLLISVPALAADGGAGLGMGKYKSNGPIEITSDQLEVLQEQNQAIFTGHVVAVQADVHLKSEKMIVYYTKPEEKAAAAKQGAGNNSIKKLDVEGGVFLSTPEETASGDHGVYDVEHQKILLNDNVVLTRGQNVLKGDHLVYDFATGKSVLNAPQGNVDGTDGKPKQRVKALFMPGSDEKLPNKK